MAHKPIDDLDRDIRQRSLGCVGASMMAHVGLLALLALGPQAKSVEPMGQPEGTTIGLTTVDLQSPPAGEAAPQALAKSQSAPPQEVLLAANDDPNAVAIPAKKAAVPEKVVEKSKSIAKPAVQVAAKPAAKPVAKPVAKAAAAKLPPPVAIVETPIAESQGDVEVEAPTQPAVTIAEQAPAEKATPVEESPKKPTEEDEDDNVETVKNVAAPAAVAVEAPPEVAPAAPVSAAIKPVPQVTAPAPRPAQPIAAQAITQAPQASALAQPASPSGTSSVQQSRAVPGQGLSQSPGVGPSVGAASLRSGGATAGIPQGMHIRDWTELVARPGNPNGTYPQQDRLLGRQGLAVVVGRVTADGSIATVQLERSSGSPTLDQEAMKTFAKWKFVPGQAGLVRKPFQFQLTGAAETMPARLGR